MKTYNTLKQIPNFQDKLKYLQLNYNLGEQVNSNRRIMDKFYNSSVWKKTKQQIILRDKGCDLGDPDYPISKYEKVLVHHIDPITSDDILNNIDKVLSPDNLITTTLDTHNKIHYSTSHIINHVERFEGDTKLW